MLNDVLLVLYFPLLLATMVLIGLAVFHFHKMIINVKPGKDVLINLTAPFSLFIDSFYTGIGNHHRRKFVVFLWLTILAMGSLFGISGYMENS